MRKKKIVYIFVATLILLFMPSTKAVNAARLKDMSVKQIVKEFQKADFPIGKVYRYRKNGKDIYTGFKSTINFFDGDSEATLRVYNSDHDAKLRYNYIKNFDDSILRQKVFRCGNVVINIDPEIKNSNWSLYKKGLKNLSAGKSIQKFPVKLNNKSLQLNIGETYDLQLGTVKSKKIKWSSNNKKIATVNKGKVVANSPGKCIVTAKYRDKKHRCTIHVLEPLKIEFPVIHFSNDSAIICVENNSTSDVIIDSLIYVRDSFDSGILFIEKVDFEEVSLDDIILHPGERKTLFYYSSRNYFLNDAQIELGFSQNSKNYVLRYQWPRGSMPITNIEQN